MDDSTVTYSRMFAGKRLLIVEDECFLDQAALRRLREFGALVIGPVDKIEDALELLEGEKVDAAILDLHLDGDHVFPVVERLENRNLPYVFAIGHCSPTGGADGFSGFVLSENPVEIEHIAKALFGLRKRDS